MVGKIYVGKTRIYSGKTPDEYKEKTTKRGNRALPKVPKNIKVIEVHTPSTGKWSMGLSPYCLDYEKLFRSGEDTSIPLCDSLYDHIQRRRFRLTKGEREIKMILLCDRHLNSESYFSIYSFPLDLLKNIFKLSFHEDEYKDVTKEEMSKILRKSFESKYVCVMGVVKDLPTILENIWQFAKVAKKSPKIKSTLRYSNTVDWENDEEVHYENGMVTKDFLKWQEKGLHNKYPVRYPRGRRTEDDYKTLFSTRFDFLKLKYDTDTEYDYITSRIETYIEAYRIMLPCVPEFWKLVRMVWEGQDVMIAEVDGPDETLMPYYKEKYKVNDDFITDGKVLATKGNLDIFLFDETRPFGHGFTIALLLLEELEKNQAKLEAEENIFKELLKKRKVGK